LLVLVLLLGIASPLCAADNRPDVWLVSTRSAPHCGDLDAGLQCLSYWHMDDSCEWSASDAGAFQAADDVATPTVVFIHGNRSDAQDAVEEGWSVYQRIREATGGQRFRYVIWSWPADPVLHCVVNDARLKTEYCDAESYYLAQWLDRLHPGVKVSLTGHSFGPRIITGALDLLAGGNVAGRSLSEKTVTAWAGGKRNPIRALLTAAASNRARIERMS
jgi:hypothetical protein